MCYVFLYSNDEAVVSKSSRKCFLFISFSLGTHDTNSMTLYAYLLLAQVITETTLVLFLVAK